MDIFTFISQLISALVWPVVILVVIRSFRTEIIDLLRSVQKVKYKDFELDIRGKVKDLVDVIPAGELEEIYPSSAEDKRILALTKEDPRQAVLAAWNQTDAIIREKLLELYPANSVEAARVRQNRIENELWLTHVLSPKEEDIFQRLWVIKDDVRSNSQAKISEETAVRYFELCKYIQHKVLSLTELPAVSLPDLTFMILVLNALIDSGKFKDITPQQVKDAMRNRTVLDFLKKHTDADLSLINQPWNQKFIDFYNEKMEDMVNTSSGDEGRKWGVENSGLALLLAWTNEIIQQGSGWYPSVK